MPTGFQLFNTSGQLLIDTNYLTYSLALKGTVAQTYQATPDYYTFRIVYSGGQAPVLFYKMRSTSTIQGPIAIGLVRCIQSGSTWEWHFDNAWAGSHAEQLMDFYIFDLKRTLVANRAGFEAYNMAGEPIFTTGAKPLNIEAVWQVPGPVLRPGSSRWHYAYPTSQEFVNGGSYRFAGLPTANWAVHVPFPRIGIEYDGSSSEHIAEMVLPTTNGAVCGAVRLGDYRATGESQLASEWQSETITPVLLFINADKY